jgi:hypothetical protein
MRLWSIHPGYLDRQGLVALWRESLLAKKVLTGKTKGYRNHPQLDRFRSSHDPLKAIDYYLYEVWREAGRRGYRFDRRKIGRPGRPRKIIVHLSQLEYEYRHLCQKIKARRSNKSNPPKPALIKTHPIFKSLPGPVEPWEKR